MEQGINIKIASPVLFDKADKEQFVRMLILGERVKEPSVEKLDKCKLLGCVYIDNHIVSIAAIKPKSKKDFSSEKADLEMLSNDFQYELGYAYTEPQYRGKGYSTALVTRIAEHSSCSLMATTHLNSDNGMISILRKLGFVSCGKTWKSKLHPDNTLALFLRYKV